MADSSEPPMKSGFFSSEFVSNAVKQIVALAGLIFVIQKLDPTTPSGTAGIVSAFIAWLGSSSIDIASFTKSRTAVKTEAIAALAPAKAVENGKIVS